MRRPRALRRVRVSIRSLEPFGIERGDTAIIAVTTDDIKPGELGFFSLAHSSGSFNQFALVCPRDRTCFSPKLDDETFSKTEGLCLRSEVRKCRAIHEGELYGRVVAVERKGESVETTLPMRLPAGYVAPPPCTTKPERKAPAFRLPDLHHEIGRELFHQLDTTPAEFEESRLTEFSSYVSYTIKERLNALARRYGLDRDAMTNEQLYLSACRVRSVETKGVTTHTPEIDSIIVAVLRHRGAAPRKPEKTRDDNTWRELESEYQQFLAEYGEDAPL